MNRTEIDPCTLGVEPGERRIKRVVVTVERRNMDPVDTSRNGGVYRIDQFNRTAEVGGRERRPAAKRTEAVMKAECDILRDQIG